MTASRIRRVRLQRLAGFGWSLLTLILLASACSATAEVEAVVQMSPADIYRSAQNSVVFVETPGGTTGTGIVIDGGWILTNAHVVGRFAQVRIGGSDGIDRGDFDVHSTDWVLDLALVGPIADDSLVAMERVPTADLAIGERVFFVGFPDESSIDPTPTLTEGIVSRRRRPSVGNFPFLQVDATIAPGQSGGALIDERGELMGISSIEFGNGEFGLALEGDALWPRVDALAASTATLVPESDVVAEIIEEAGPLRSVGFVIEVGDDGQIDLEATSDDDLWIDVQTLGGETHVEFAERLDYFVVGEPGTRYYINDAFEGGEKFSGEVVPGTYQVVVGSLGAAARPVTVTSSNPIRRFDDLEEGAALPVGQLVEGVVDWSGDSDRWTLSLEAGQRVTIVADGLADTALAVRLDDEPVATSDDDGLGVFGTGATVEFVADATGDYEVEVGSYDEVRWGYLVEVTVS